MGIVVLSEVSELTTVKISELPEATSMGNNDVLPIVKVEQPTEKIAKANFIKNIPILAENIVYVAKNGSDSNTGTIGDPFLTIETANNYAIANRPPWPGRIVVKVAPGIYTEHLTQGYYRVYIVGDTRTPDEKEKDVTIRNLGDTPINYPLGMTGKLNLIGINIVTTDIDNEPIEGIYGELLESSTFSACNLMNGYFVEQATPTSIYMQFTFCHFQGGKDFVLTGTVNQHRALAFGDCTLEGKSVFASSGTDTKYIKLDNSYVTDEIKIEGDWSLTAQSSELHHNGSFTFDTDGDIDLYNSIIVNGLHFVSDTPGSKRFVNNYFRAVTFTSDITVASGTVISIVDFSGNKMDKGLCKDFQIAGGQRNVGGFAENKYTSLQCAVYSIPENESGIITLHENETDLDKLILNTGSKVTIKCGKKHSLSFIGDVVELGENQELSWHEVHSLSGGEIKLNGDNALLSFEGCLTAQCYIVATSGVGSMVLFYYSSLLGATGQTFLQIDNADTLIVSGYSRLKGAVGQPAVAFNILTVNKFKAKFSTFLHGDGGSNRPIVYLPTSGKADVAIYNSASNAGLDTSDFNNLIGSPNLTISSEIDF